MKLHYTLLALLLGLITRPVSAQGALDCGPLFGQRPEKEASFLRLAPHGASRPTEHRLIVGWSKGSREFVDQAPYQVHSQEGTRHLYCGYDPVVGMHLIYRADTAASQGLLLNDATGEILPGGERVIFSGDRARYLALVQIDGADGKEWRVYSSTGKEMWSGFDCTPVANSRFCTPLEAPRWNTSAELEAVAKCWREADQAWQRKSVTLRLVNGRWAWTPTCRGATI